jgi:hypothetical protein
METIDVPSVTQLPELSGGVENPDAFVDMVLTTLLRFDRAFLYAEHGLSDSPDLSVSWRIFPQMTDIVSREFEAGLSPCLVSFRSSLSYIRQRYMGDSMRHGCADRFLRQGNCVRRCLLFLPCSDESGAWIRAYVSER